MRCLRVFGAYSFRLTRRHSTVIFIACFIFGLTMILQLYAHRHHDPPLRRRYIGDFDYKPGAFLRGKQPNENITYCQFNYGLPDTLKWENISVQPSPEIGVHGNYRVIYNAIRSTAYDNVSKYDAVTYVTHATPEYIYHIVEVARYWDGPISLSVFVPNYDLDITMQIMEQLCHCYPAMAKVSLHLFYSKDNPPRISREPVSTLTTMPKVATTNITIEALLKKKIEDYRKLNNRTRAEYVQNSIKKKIKMMEKRVSSKLRTSAPNLEFEDCSGLDSYDMPTYRRLRNMMYPINVGRNSARKGAMTNYFLVSDIEMVPSEALAPKFVNMLRKLMGSKKRNEGYTVPKTVFVVPVFEVEMGERIPRDKDTLVALVAENRAMYFHQKICSHCQRFPGLQTWLKRPSSEEVQPMMIAKREYPYHRWEPLYFGTNREPWYSERLSWEGLQDKMTQMLELCLQGYRMVILDGGFLCHAAKLDSRSQNSLARHYNARQYLHIIEGFKHTYPDRHQCKINYGFKVR